MAANMQAAGHRENNFDSLRIIAALAVIYGHAHPLTATPDVMVMGSSVQGMAVKVFFAISGYLVARSWVFDPNFGRYITKRALRIFPALALVLLFSVFVVGVYFNIGQLGSYFSNSTTWHYLIDNLRLKPAYSLPNLFADNPYPNAVNGSLWSLPVEFLMYLTFPAVYGFSRVARSNSLYILFTLAFVATSIYFIRIAPVANPIVVYGSPVSAMLDVGPYFFVGSLFATTKLEGLLDPYAALFMVLAATLLQPTNAVATELVVYLVLPYATLSFAVGWNQRLSKMGKYGDPSYGIYLYGFLVQQAVIAIWPFKMSAVENAISSAVITVLLAYASWHILEKHAIRFKPKPKAKKPT